MKPVQFTAAVPNGEVIFWDVECSHRSLRCAAMSSQLESAAEAMGMRVGIKTNSGCVPRQRVCGCLGVRLTARQSNKLALTKASRLPTALLACKYSFFNRLHFICLNYLFIKFQMDLLLPTP